MKYYLNSIEQIITEGAYSEYSSSTKKNDLKSATTDFFDKCKNVNADLGVNHSFMSIKIEDSQGNIIKKEVLGEYVESEA